MDHENELDLLYTVITLPEGEETVAQLCFLDDNTGKITKTVPLPTWNPVCIHQFLIYMSITFIG